MTGASCLSSSGWRSVREASNWPMGPTDGASGLGVEQPGQAFKMDLWVTHEQSVSHKPTQRHEAECFCPFGAAHRSFLLLQENRKWNSVLLLTVSLEYFHITKLTFDYTIIWVNSVITKPDCSHDMTLLWRSGNELFLLVSKIFVFLFSRNLIITFLTLKMQN